MARNAHELFRTSHANGENSAPPQGQAPPASYICFQTLMRQDFFSPVQCEKGESRQ